MFDFVHNNNTAIKVILGAVALTFVGFGVGSYSAAVDDPYLAKVGDSKIYKRDVEQLLQDQPANAASRQMALETLIRQEMLLAEARHGYLAVPDSRLQQVIANIPALQDGGKFSAARYEEFLKARHLTAEAFEAQVSRDLLLQAQVRPYLNGQFVSRTLTSRMGALLSEVRDVSQMAFSPEQFAQAVKLGPEMIKAYYEANQKRFSAAESVKLEYVTLSREALAQGIVVSDSDAKAYFDQHQSDFASEERDVSHILITVDKSASADVRAKAKAQAEALLKQAKANPASFAQLATQHSQDPGSAANGGSLGFFGRGAMVKPFEEAAFKLAPGQISDIVETEFGYHILKLNALRGSDFDSQKAAVIAKLQKQKAEALFRSQSEKLNELAYQQANSLAPIQSALKLEIKQTDLLSREGVGGDPVWSNGKLLEAVFGDDVLKKKHNSEAIDVGNGNLVVARVIAHQPARQKPMAEVEAEIRSELTRQEAAKLAAQQGEKVLASLKAGQPASGVWSGPQALSRKLAGQLPAADMRTIFAVQTKTLPAYAGVKRDNGAYVLYRIDKVQPGAALQPAETAQLGNMLGELSGNSVLVAYLDQLRQKHKVMISQTPAE